MKILLSNIILPFLLTLLNYQKTDFTGSWVIDKSKVNFDGAPEWVLPKALKAIQAPDNIIVITTQLNEDLTEKAPVTDGLSFAGKSFMRIKSDSTQILSTAKWIGDDSLRIEVRSGKRDVIETWSLQDNGKTLVENRDVEQANGLKYVIKVYYDKQ